MTVNYVTVSDDYSEAQQSTPNCSSSERVKLLPPTSAR